MKSRNQSDFKKPLESSKSQELKEKIQYIRETNSQAPTWLVFLVRAIGAFMLVTLLPVTFVYLIQVIAGLKWLLQDFMFLPLDYVGSYERFRNIGGLLFGILSIFAVTLLTIIFPSSPYWFFRLIRDGY
ncbi:MAG: hypothetical protein AAF378_02070 [Cyanobacteria bacterium P01_A01_bin.84]